LFASYSTVEKCVSIGRHIVLSDINIGRISVLAFILFWVVHKTNNLRWSCLHMKKY